MRFLIFTTDLAYTDLPAAHGGTKQIFKDSEKKPMGCKGRGARLKLEASAMRHHAARRF